MRRNNLLADHQDECHRLDLKLLISGYGPWFYYLFNKDHSFIRIFSNCEKA